MRFLLFTILFHFYEGSAAYDRDTMMLIHLGAITPNQLYEQEFKKVLNYGSESVEMNLNLGPIVGNIAEVDGTKAEVYNSIPYAKSPVGERRLENPEPLNPWKTKINTTKIIECWQFKEYRHFSLWNDEDCLFFKAVIPLDANGERYKEKLPTVFWIHGGSYILGSKEYYKIKQIIQHFSSRKIIFIAPNYRLGVYGFLSALHPDLLGNYGLEDILLALNVVRDNADGFGIDIDHITVAGESAGGGAASILAVSPRAKGLFSSIYLNSGSSLGAYSVRTTSTNISTYRFAEICKCNRSTVIEMKNCMKSAGRGCLDARYKEIVTTGHKNSWYETFRMGSSTLTPVVDALRGNLSIVPKKMEELIQEEARVPMLISGVPHERHFKEGIEREFDIMKYHIRQADELKKVIRNKTDSLISWNLKSRNVMHPLIFNLENMNRLQIVQALRQKYNLLEGKELSNNIVQLLTDDVLAAYYAEALLYAERGQTVYLIENKVQPNASAYTLHGADTAVLFNETRISICRTDSECDPITAQNWTNNFIEILTEFIKTRKIESILPFKTNHRNAYQVSVNGTELIDFHTDAYYFWRLTVPTLENLLLDDSISSIADHNTTSTTATAAPETGKK